MTTSHDSPAPRLNYPTASFIISAPTLALCPDDTGAEVAFAGRSNAGKSSAINALTQQNALARTSRTPGRTQLINFFSVMNDESRRLVDLPGYGYAKVPLELKAHWQQHLDAYLTGRQSLVGLVLVMDLRHPLSDFDCMMLEWARKSDIPAHVLLSKADKMAFGAAKNALLKVQTRMRKELGSNASVQLFSSPKRMGIEEAHGRLAQWLFPVEQEGSEG